jgi:RNA polymerase sigma-70 factor (ECF subfamily)
MGQLVAESAELGELEQYRGELTGYCYRMLGSVFDADDAVQETLLRAWQRADQFEGRASLRSWLYRIATNVCLDALRGRKRRALPMDLSSPVPATTVPEESLPGEIWLEPLADAELRSPDPADRAVASEGVRLAFVAALQHLPPKQRAVLILREVLAWSAAETAELLDTTVAGVNSALQRARATMATSAVAQPGPLDGAQQALLDRYVAAFEAYDIDALVQLLAADASISMPPIAMWLRGREELRTWYLGTGIGCKGSRLLPLALNGSPGFAQYRPSPEGGWAAWSLQVLEVSDGAVRHVHHFLDTALFARFRLPQRLR